MWFGANPPTNRKSIGPHTNLFFPEASKMIAMAGTLVVFDNSLRSNLRAHQPPTQYTQSTIISLPAAIALNNTRYPSKMTCDYDVISKIKSGKNGLTGLELFCVSGVDYPLPKRQTIRICDGHKDLSSC